ncbi:MAG: glycosyltransferase, partial [Thiothrix sp.]
LSQSPQRIIYNTDTSAEQHTAMGYAAHKTQVIANGFDTQYFCPDAYQRETLRHACKIPDDALLIGMTHDPAQQAMTLFVQAAKLIMPHQPNTYFIVAGTHAPQRAQALLHTLPYPHRFKVLGQRDDINAVLNALDIFTFIDDSPHYPEQLAEAMACGLPCMALGASHLNHLLATTGGYLRPEETTPSALAFAWLDWINAGAVWWQALGKRARQHIIQYHTIQNVVATYQQLYRHVHQQTHIPHKNLPSLMSAGSALL